MKHRNLREKDIEKRVTAWAKRNGVLTIKLEGQHNRGKPDRIFMANGEVLFLELKAPGKKPTELQASWIDKIKAQGCNADWADNDGEAIEMITNYLLL